MGQVVKGLLRLPREIADINRFFAADAGGSAYKNAPRGLRAGGKNGCTGKTGRFGAEAFGIAVGGDLPGIGDGNAGRAASKSVDDQVGAVVANRRRGGDGAVEGAGAAQPFAISLIAACVKRHVSVGAV